MIHFLFSLLAVMWTQLRHLREDEDAFVPEADLKVTNQARPKEECFLLP